MSILIKGAKMPTGCGACDYVQYDVLYADNWYCPLTDKSVNKYMGDNNDIPPSCPLVEIPPHGRLIDASEMAIKFSCRDIDITTLKKLHEWLMEIPTVIESEEE